ncbi:MAG: methyl-accepting chemotaxis protein [Alphaproteobacteria bacterium]
MTSSSSVSRAFFALAVSAPLAVVLAVMAAVRGEWGAFAVALGLVAVTLAGVVFLRRAMEQIGVASRALDKVCNGLLDSRVIGIREGGELGAVMHGVNALLDLTEAFAKEANTAMAYTAKGKYFRRIQLKGMRGEFAQYAQTVNSSLETMEQTTQAFIKGVTAIGDNILGVVDSVTSTAKHLRGEADDMSKAASSSSTQATTVTGAAEQASANVEQVAVATEQVSSHIAEVAEQVSRSARMAAAAVERAARTDDTIRSLSEAAQKIGEVAQLIAQIASQTNLLALNATIEAARAGEAGKGFAVVANEVKQLANQTARATEEIGQHIAAIQNATVDSVSALREIGSAIRDINDIASSVAGSAAEQGSVVRTISANVRQAASGVHTVAETISRVAEGASTTQHGATEVLSAASDLTQKAGKLREDISLFVDDICRRSL